QSAFTFRWKHALHFLPFLIFALLIPAFFHESILSWRSVGYGMLTVFDPFNEDLTAWNYAYGSIFIGQFLHAFVYTALSYRFVKQQEIEARELTSSLHIGSFRWLKRFQLMNLIILVGVGIFVYYLFETQVYRRQMDYFLVLPIAISTYAYSLLAFLNPQQLWAGNLPDRREKYQKSSLSKKHSREMVEGVRSIMETQKPFLNADLRLTELAEIMSISPHHLSQVINENLQLNFYDFINQYRVEEAKALIEKEPETNLLQIGIAAGFNNKNSFNNAFKKHMGLTPSTYRKEIHQK
ncbi:MAG: helix-turn-helix domain-containing protein, partial [Bacteroidota bacterium]